MSPIVRTKNRNGPNARSEMGDTTFPCLGDKKKEEAEKDALGGKPGRRRKEKCGYSFDTR